MCLSATCPISNVRAQPRRSPFRRQPGCLEHADEARRPQNQLKGRRNDVMTVTRFVTLASTLLLVIPGLRSPLTAQEPAARTGTIAGRVVDEEGAAVGGVQIYIDRPVLSTQTRNNGEYL